jgi:hypothetical protein
MYDALVLDAPVLEYTVGTTKSTTCSEVGIKCDVFTDRHNV